MIHVAPVRETARMMRKTALQVFHVLQEKRSSHMESQENQFTVLSSQEIFSRMITMHLISATTHIGQSQIHTMKEDLSDHATLASKTARPKFILSLVEKENMYQTQRHYILFSVPILPSFRSQKMPSKTFLRLEHSALISQ